MLYFARFEVGQPAGMSLDQFLAHWYEEAKAAQQAQAAGVVKGLWKVAGQRVVLAVLDLPDHDAVDRALAALPSFAVWAGRSRPRCFLSAPMRRSPKTCGGRWRVPQHRRHEAGSGVDVPRPRPRRIKAQLAPVPEGCSDAIVRITRRSPGRRQG